MQQNQQLHLQENTSKILCSEHKFPVILLNIGPEARFGNRLLCAKCPTTSLQTVLIEKVQSYFTNNFLDQNQAAIQQEINDFHQLHDLIRKTLQELERQYLNLIESVNRKLHTLMMVMEQQSNLNNIAQNFQLKTVSEAILQETALLLSEQGILKVTLQMKDKFEPIISKVPINQSIENLSHQFNHINDAFKQTLKYNKQLYLDLNIQKYMGPIQLEGHNNRIIAVAISSDDKLMASAGCDYKNQKTIKFEYDGGVTIQDLVFSQNNNWLAAAQFWEPNNILLFNVNNLEKSPSITLQGHSGSIYRIAFTNNSKILLSGSNDRTLKLWDIENRTIIKNKELSDEVYGLSISQNEEFISAGCRDGLAYLFDSFNIEKIKDLTEWKADTWVQCTNFTHDSMNVLTGFKEIKIWSIKKLRSRYQKNTPSKIITINHPHLQTTNFDCWSLILRKQGQILISSSEKIQIYNIETGQLIVSLFDQDEQKCFNEQNAAVTSNLRYIIVGGKNKLNVYELLDDLSK